MSVPAILQLPNLLSLSRILLAPIIGYLLSVDTPEATGWCVALYIVAGITDWLDGFFARIFNQVSQFGIALDPICDKVFAGLVIVSLVLYREMPLWLAFVIVGRDLVILLAGGILLRGKKVVIPSNHFGKYAFGSVAVLLGSYIIRFPFGISLMIPITLSLIVVSLISYGRVFAIVKRGGAVPTRDRRWYLLARYTAAFIIAGIYLFGLIRFLSE